MDTLSQLTIYLRKQRLEINKIHNAIEINCIFNNPNMQDMIDLFAFGCKLLDVSIEEAIDNRKIQLPIMNWQYERMFISNLDRFEIGKAKPFFRIYLSKSFPMTRLQSIANRVVKENNTLPKHKPAVIVFEDGSYKNDIEIETLIAIKPKEYVIGEYIPPEPVAEETTPQEMTEMNEVPPNSPATSEPNENSTDQIL